MRKSDRKTAAGRNGAAEKVVELDIPKPIWEHAKRTAAENNITVEEYIRRLIRIDVEKTKGFPVRMVGNDLVFTGAEGKKLYMRFVRVAKTQGKPLKQVLRNALEWGMSHAGKWQTKEVTLDRRTWQRAQVLAQRDGLSVEGLYEQLIEREHAKVAAHSGGKAK